MSACLKHNLSYYGTNECRECKRDQIAKMGKGALKKHRVAGALLRKIELFQRRRGWSPKEFQGFCDTLAIKCEETAKILRSK